MAEARFEGSFDAHPGLSANKLLRLKATLMLGLLAACSGPSSIVNPDISPDMATATSQAAEGLAFAEANQALESWRQFQAGGDTYVLSSQIGVLTEENNPNQLITLNPLQDGAPNSNVDWGVGIGEWTNTTTNEQMTRLIFLKDEGGTIQTYGLMNVVEDTESRRVFAVSQVEGGMLADADMEVVVDKTAGSATIGIRNETTGEITYLVDPSTAANPTPSPTDVPRPVVDQLISVSSEGGPSSGGEVVEIPKPTVEHGLSPQNAKDVVVENGTWVVKDPEGEITARFDAEKQEWTYNHETIEMDVQYINPTHAPGLPASLLEGQSFNFSDVVTDELLQEWFAAPEGENLLFPTGEISTYTRGVQNYLGERGEETHAVIPVDLLGMYKIGTNEEVGDQYVLIVGYRSPTHPDYAVILGVPANDTDKYKTRMYFFASGDEISQDTVAYGNYPQSTFIPIFRSLIGQRIGLDLVINTTITVQPELAPQEVSILVNALQNGEEIRSSLDPKISSSALVIPRSFIP